MSKRVANIWPEISPWSCCDGDFCGRKKKCLSSHLSLALSPTYLLLVKRERTMSTSPMMMIVWQKSSPLSRASTAIASSVLSLLSGTAFKMISDVIFRSQKRAPARASASIRPLLTIINQGRPSTTLQSWRYSRLATIIWKKNTVLILLYDRSQRLKASWL